MEEIKRYLVKNNDLSIRRMEVYDFELMAKWLSDHQVLEYFGNINEPYNLEMIIQKYSPRVEGKNPIVPCIVEYGNAPIGFIQYYPSNEDKSFGIDQFIGEPNLWGKGIGTSLIQEILVYLRNHTEANRVVLDPHKTNKRAIRCYEKAGFKAVRPLLNDLLLMEYIFEKNQQ
jgi:aminoglycoside 6'-N-acetyltransferase